MGRISGPLTGAALLVVVIGLVIRYLTFGVNTNDRHIVASSLADALEQLGHLHAERAPWVTFHLRQVALSGSAPWLGQQALPSDQRTAELHIAERARAAWETLSGADQRLVEAYTRGINQALTERRVRLAAAFVLLNVTPEPWEPWQTLAVERLVLWLQGDALSAADSILQHQIGWYGGTWNVAWGSGNGATMGRFLMGDTAAPFLHEVLIDWPGTSMTALTVPGTLMLPMARRETGAQAASWAYLLQPNVTRASGDGRARGATDWVRLHDGRRDTIITVSVPDTTRGLLSHASGPDLAWPGFTDQTDTDSWLALWRGQDALDAWQLMRPDGLKWTRSAGAWRVLGTPRTLRQVRGVVMIAAQPPERTPAAVMDRFSLVDLPTSFYSGTAQSGLDTLLQALPDSSSLPRRTRQAVTYLANWNTRFDGGEIGATLYDAMISTADTVSTSSVEERLTQAMTRVERVFGPDMSLWRWSNAHPAQLRWPGWHAPNDSMPRPIRIFMEQYPPVDVRTGGHPTTMVWRQATGAPASNAWEGLLRSDGSLAYRSRRVPYQQFLADHAAINEIHELRRRN